MAYTNSGTISSQELAGQVPDTEADANASAVALSPDNKLKVSNDIELNAFLDNFPDYVDNSIKGKTKVENCRENIKLLKQYLEKYITTAELAEPAKPAKPADPTTNPKSILKEINISLIDMVKVYKDVPVIFKKITTEINKVYALLTKYETSVKQNNGSKIAVATYNMSFMSALGYPVNNSVRQGSSEGAFLAQNTTVDQKLYWTNALNLLISFIQYNHNAGITCVIGLQEIIGPNGSTNREVYENTRGMEIGSAEITAELNKFNTDNKTKYTQVVDEVSAMFGANKSDIGLSIIYDTNRFGDKKDHKIYDACFNATDIDLRENIKYKDVGKYYLQAGRPLLIVVTNNNYVFITAPGAQDPKLFPKYLDPDKSNMDELTKQANLDFIEFKAKTTRHQTYIQDRVSDYLTKAEIKPNGLFLMADLNDRFDVIKDFKFIINTKPFNINYTGQAPNSCCNNWDASCKKDGRYIELDKNGNGYCIQPVELPDGSVRKSDNIVSTSDKFKIAITDGEKENYRYRCDKVFGKKPTEEEVIKIYDDQPKNTVSNASDHQMVYALFDDTATDENVVKTN